MPFIRITVSADQMGGIPCIRGLRVPVATVVAMVADGMTEAEILDCHAKGISRLINSSPLVWARRPDFVRGGLCGVSEVRRFVAVELGIVQDSLR